MNIQQLFDVYWLEVFGVLCCLLYIYLEIKQRVSLWIVGFISSAITAIVFFQRGLYAFSALYVYYVAASIYGMYYWSFSKKTDNEPKKELPISRLNMKQAIVLTVISAALVATIGYVLANYTNSATPPYLEALASSLSIVATWMLARKILEQWLVWIFVNLFSAVLNFWCGIYLYSALFVVYGVMSVVGWFNWKNTNLKPQMK